MPLSALPHFSALPGLYEPSGVVQLADGRLLAVEDEKAFPFSLFSFDADGRLAGPPHALAAPDKLNDLEGLTLGPTGRFYAITSHSRDGEGERKKSRCRLLRFRVEGEALVDAAVFERLLPALGAAHPALAAAIEVADVKSDGGLNVEGLEMAPDGRELLVGLRGPLIGGRAVVAALAEPDALFDTDASPRISLRLIDLGGQGIRGMAWLGALGGYLLISGPLTGRPEAFGLWLWDGAGASARRVAIPGVPTLARAEGVCAASVGGRPMVLLVSDDGERATGRCASYLLVEAAHLQLAA